MPFEREEENPGDEINRTRVVRLGEHIVIQWLSISGRPMQTISLSILETLRVAKEVQRRAEG